MMPILYDFINMVIHNLFVCFSSWLEDIGDDVDCAEWWYVVLDKSCRILNLSDRGSRSELTVIAAEGYETGGGCMFLETPREERGLKMMD